MNPIKVIIADDHPLISEGIQNMLRYHNYIEVIGVFKNGEELLKHLETVQPDVLLLDINMPILQGDEVAKIVLKKWPLIRIIILTNIDSIYYINNLIQIGVSGYVLKNIEKPNLIHAIETVYNGNTYLDDTVKSKMQEVNIQLRKQNNTGNSLTRREKEILQLIVENNTSKEIANKLHISKRTVDHHRESIQLKLDVKNLTELVQQAIELGLVQM